MVITRVNDIPNTAPQVEIILGENEPISAVDAEKLHLAPGSICTTPDLSIIWRLSAERKWVVI